mmetsp:Transcript_184/g.451  ORF Transcript_184/g.451 Transcript_184/m.451 type:complete len:257 (-) Transcript_184:92-862(-)
MWRGRCRSPSQVHLGVWHPSGHPSLVSRCSSRPASGGCAAGCRAARGARPPGLSRPGGLLISPSPAAALAVKPRGLAPAQAPVLRWLRLLRAALGRVPAQGPGQGPGLELPSCRWRAPPPPAASGARGRIPTAQVALSRSQSPPRGRPSAAREAARLHQARARRLAAAAACSPAPRSGERRARRVKSWGPGAMQAFAKRQGGSAAPAGDGRSSRRLAARGGEGGGRPEAPGMGRCSAAGKAPGARRAPATRRRSAG